MADVTVKALFILNDQDHTLTVAVGLEDEVVVALDGVLLTHRAHVADAMASLRAIVNLVTREGLVALPGAPGNHRGGGF